MSRKLWLRDENGDVAEIVEIGLSEGRYTDVVKTVVVRDQGGFIRETIETDERWPDEVLQGFQRTAEAQSLALSELYGNEETVRRNETDAAMHDLTKLEYKARVALANAQLAEENATKMAGLAKERLQAISRVAADYEKFPRKGDIHLDASAVTAFMEAQGSRSRDPGPDTWLEHGTYEQLNLEDRVLLHDRARRRERHTSPTAIGVTKLNNGRYATRSRRGP